MNALADWLDHLPGAVPYAITAAAVLAEAVLLLGAVVPTFTILLSAGALARAGHLHLLPVVGAAAGAVIIGDAAAHRVGRALGDRIRRPAVGRRIPDRAWTRAADLMARTGGRAVLIARFIPVVRTVTPYLAGAVGLPYRRISPFSIVAAVLWATAETGAGYLAAASPGHPISLGALVAAGAGVAVCAGGILARARRGRR